MLTICLSLGTAACYGTADFFGGLATRTSSVTKVLLTSHGVSLVLLLIAMIFLPTPHPTSSDWMLSVAAGVCALVGLLALYRALGGGHMVVVSAISAVLSALVPAMVGVAAGEQLAAIGWAGVALGLAATVLVSAGAHAVGADSDPIGRTVVLSIVAGLGIGLMLALTSRCTAEAGVAPVVVMRTMSVVALGSFVGSGWLRQSRPGPGGPRQARPSGVARPSFLPSRPGLAALAGCLDVLGTILFMRASLAGAVAVAAVLAAQYPLVTATMARIGLGERLTRTQVVGFAATLVSVGLLAAGR